MFCELFKWDIADVLSNVRPDTYSFTVYRTRYKDQDVLTVIFSDELADFDEDGRVYRKLIRQLNDAANEVGLSNDQFILPHYKLSKWLEDRLTSKGYKDSILKMVYDEMLTYNERIKPYDGIDRIFDVLKNKLASWFLK